MVDVVNEYLLEEKSYADLLHQVIDPHAPSDVTESGNINGDYVEMAEKLGVSEFEHLRHSDLPKKLREHLNRTQTEFKMGIFTKLSRAWLTHDNEIFLWDFETNRDLAFYDGIKSKILKVEVANVKPGLFEPAIKYFLIIVTAEEIVLLTLSFVSEQMGKVQVQINEDRDALLVIKPVHKMPLEGISVDKICCSSDGRIFFSSEEHLYEISYYFTFLGYLAFKKVNLTRGFLSALNIFTSKDNIRQVVCDDSRHILFTLSKASKIAVYDLGPNGNDFKYVTSYSVSTLKWEVGGGFNAHQELLSEILSIAVIPSTRSMFLNLVATLNSGYRAYFTCLDQVVFEKGNDRFSQNNIRPVELRLVHFRHSPVPAFSFLHSNLTSYYTKVIDDVTIVAFLSVGPAQSPIFALSSANYSYSTRFQESKAILPVKKILSIEAPSSPSNGREIFISKRDNTEFELVPSTLPKSFAFQHAKPVESFHVVTSDGIDTFSHLKPVEVLKRILRNSGSRSRQFSTFLDIHGSSEICVMALILMAGGETVESQIKEMAYQVFIAQGGHPSMVVQASNIFDDFSPGIRFATDVSSKSPMFSSTPGRQVIGSEGDTPTNDGLGANLSRSSLSFGRHQLSDISHISSSSRGQPVIGGLCLKPSDRSRALFTLFARIVYPIWHKNVCGFEGGVYVSGIKFEEVCEILRHVCGLIKVVEHYSLFAGAYQGGDKNGTHAIESLKQEKNSVAMLTEVMMFTKEYLCLWQIILEKQSFNSVVSHLDPELQEKFSNFLFIDLILSSKSVGFKLISALNHYYFRDAVKSSEINERLNNECPRLFTNEDADILKASELIYDAKETQRADERQSQISQGVMILKRHAKRVKLDVAIPPLKEMNCFKEIADLVITCADASDPHGLALILYTNPPKTENKEMKEMKEANDRRNKCYYYLTDTLEYLHNLADVNVAPYSSLSGSVAEIERDQFINFILNSVDELAHVFLFRFLVDKKLEKLVTRKKNSLFERFLSREIENGGDSQYYDLLWRYYDAVGEFEKESLLLYELATTGNHFAKLDKKTDYLSQALTCLNFTHQTPQIMELRKKIQDWSEVADIQKKIRDALKYAPPNTFEVSVLNETLSTLEDRLLTLGNLLQIVNRFELPEIKREILTCAGVKEGSSL